MAKGKSKSQQQRGTRNAARPSGAIIKNQEAAVGDEGSQHARNDGQEPNPTRATLRRTARRISSSRRRREGNPLVVQWFTFGTLVLYTFATFLLWQEMKASNTSSQKIADANVKMVEATLRGIADSKNLAETAQRAQITFYKCDDLRRPFEDQSSCALLNTGQTTATGVRIKQILVSYRGSEKNPELEIKKSHAPWRSLPAMGHDMDASVTIVGKLSSYDWQQSLYTAWRLMAAGQVAYYDGFHPRITSYCYIFNNETRTWSQCKTGNSAD